MTKVEELEKEIERLRAELEICSSAKVLAEALQSSGIVGEVLGGEGHRVLLDQIVTTARRVVGTEGVTLFLSNPESEELVVEVVRGGAEEAVRELRLPYGEGLAGYVAMTGQMLAVEDVRQDPRWAQEVGDDLRYTPQRILCAPLLRDEEVIGVLQFIDKKDGAAFTLEDMEMVGEFAEVAASALFQSRVASDLQWFFRSLLGELDENSMKNERQILSAARRVSEDQEYLERLEIACKLGRALRSGRSSQVLFSELLDTVITFKDRQGLS